MQLVITPDESASHSLSTPAPPSTASERLPLSFANGRYQVKELLGEGGRKRVYRAHDTVLDRDIALAVIKTEGLDATSRVRITREARPWVASATVLMSCPSTTSATTMGSLTWSCLSCPVETSKA